MIRERGELAVTLDDLLETFDGDLDGGGGVLAHVLIEAGLFDAAISADPDKIIVKRPLKSDFLAGRKPSYTLSGKAIRYDCYTL